MPPALVDATRILLRNAPAGGRLEDRAMVDALTALRKPINEGANKIKRTGDLTCHAAIPDPQDS